MTCSEPVECSSCEHSNLWPIQRLMSLSCSRGISCHRNWERNCFWKEIVRSYILNTIKIVQIALLVALPPSTTVHPTHCPWHRHLHPVESEKLWQITPTNRAFITSAAMLLHAQCTILLIRHDEPQMPFLQNCHHGCWRGKQLSKVHLELNH